MTEHGSLNAQSLNESRNQPASTDGDCPYREPALTT